MAKGRGETSCPSLLPLSGIGVTHDLSEDFTNVVQETILIFFQNVLFKWGWDLVRKTARLSEMEDEIKHVVGLLERI